jgi:hypothetical protein
MTCPAQAFNSVTPAHFATIVQKAAAAGIHINGNAGEVSHFAATIRWRFDPDTGVFAVQCTRRPFMVSCATMNRRINELVSLCRPMSAKRATRQR